MATATEVTKIGPEDHGRRMTLDEFVEADFTEGWLYELARGIVVVTEVPGPNHGLIVWRIEQMFDSYHNAHPGLINYRASGSNCRLRLPGMVCDRHPDEAIYLTPLPSGKRIWQRWIPELVVEIVIKGGEDRDYVEKREEYLFAGVLEYWILDPWSRTMLVLIREAEAWREVPYAADGVHRTELLPGLEAVVGELLGPAFKEE